VAEADAEHYWDSRARENALYFVNNELDYRAPDAEAFWRSGVEAVDRLLASVRLEVEPADRLLDIGCGVGRLTRALAARAAHVTGIDISSRMLAQARELNRHLTNVEWIHGDGHSLSGVPDASLDGCFSHVVFQHLPRAELTLGYVGEIGRVLRPGGWSAFQVSTDPRVHENHPGVRERVKGVLRAGPRGLADPAWRGSSVELRALRAAAGQSGLRVEALVGGGTQFTIVGLRRDGSPATSRG